MADDKLGQKLLALKKDIEKKKSERSELQGEQKSLLKQLKDEFGVDTIEAAEKLLREKETDLEKLTTNVTNKVRQIEELMG